MIHDKTIYFGLLSQKNVTVSRLKPACDRKLTRIYEHAHRLFTRTHRPIYEHTHTYLY